MNKIEILLEPRRCLGRWCDRKGKVLSGRWYCAKCAKKVENLQRGTSKREIFMHRVQSFLKEIVKEITDV